MGAWIETNELSSKAYENNVAPYVGAWIETYICLKVKVSIIKSHPTWVRGLKHRATMLRLVHRASHPTWVRGLKLC